VPLGTPHSAAPTRTRGMWRVVEVPAARPALRGSSALPELFKGLSPYISRDRRAGQGARGREWRKGDTRWGREEDARARRTTNAHGAKNAFPQTSRPAPGLAPRAITPAVYFAPTTAARLCCERAPLPPPPTKHQAKVAATNTHYHTQAMQPPYPTTYLCSPRSRRESGWGARARHLPAPPQ
jgi:hypothetical protein